MPALDADWKGHAFGPIENDAKSSLEEPNPKRAVGGVHKAYTRHLIDGCDRTTDRSYLSTAEIGDGSKDGVWPSYPPQPAPRAPRPASLTPRPAARSPHPAPAPRSLHPAPCTPRPAPCTLHPSSRTSRHPPHSTLTPHSRRAAELRAAQRVGARGGPPAHGPEREGLSARLRICRRLLRAQRRRSQRLARRSPLL